MQPITYLHLLRTYPHLQSLPWLNQPAIITASQDQAGHIMPTLNPKLKDQSSDELLKLPQAMQMGQAGQTDFVAKAFQQLAEVVARQQLMLAALADRLPGPTAASQLIANFNPGMEQKNG
jgi:hypothetical protein